jgi:hypothetical protein
VIPPSPISAHFIAEIFHKRTHFPIPSSHTDGSSSN